MNTPNLSLEPLVSAQAQKHITVNEAFARIDAATQLAVLDRDVLDPPVSPADGDRYLIPASATGAWSGHDGKIAAWEDATVGWLFLIPRIGWRLWVIDENTLVVLANGGWQELGGGGGSGLSLNPSSGGMIGVNTTADATNRLAVKAESALFSHDDAPSASGDMRLTLNKATPADDTSLTFQTGFSARAQVGLTGADDLVVKTSPDGAAFTQALYARAADGAVVFPGGAHIGGDAAHNHLDIYEEGVFTPTLSLNSSSPAMTYGFQAARYVRIGRLVHFDINVRWTAQSGGSGYWIIQGLPFVAGVGGHYSQVYSYDHSGIHYGPDREMFGGYIAPGSTTITMIASSSQTGSGAIFTLDQTGVIYMSGSYQT